MRALIAHTAHLLLARSDAGSASYGRSRTADAVRARTLPTPGRAIVLGSAPNARHTRPAYVPNARTHRAHGTPVPDPRRRRQRALATISHGWCGRCTHATHAGPRDRPFLDATSTHGHAAMCGECAHSPRTRHTCPRRAATSAARATRNRAAASTRASAGLGRREARRAPPAAPPPPSSAAPREDSPGGTRRAARGAHDRIGRRALLMKDEKKSGGTRFRKR